MTTTKTADARFAELVGTLGQKEAIYALQDEGFDFNVACDAAERYARRQPGFATKMREARRAWNNEEY